MVDPFEQLGREFLASEFKGVEISNIAETIQEIMNNADLPVVVLERRNKFYLVRKNQDAEAS